MTNKEFLEFVRDGGYQRRELWTEEGQFSLIAAFHACLHCTFLGGVGHAQCTYPWIRMHGVLNPLS